MVLRGLGRVDAVLGDQRRRHGPLEALAVPAEVQPARHHRRGLDPHPAVLLRPPHRRPALPLHPDLRQDDHAQLRRQGWVHKTSLSVTRIMTITGHLLPATYRLIDFLLIF